LSQLKELASEKNSYHTVKGEIESVKHIIYKVAYPLPPSICIIKFCQLGLC
jgi:hypothetical protein